MSIKAIVLAAATVAVTASAASADSYFMFSDRLDDSSIAELGTVRAEGAGVVEIYDYTRGEAGALLGAKSVNAGANSNVRINLGKPPSQDVIAILKVDGQVVAERQYEVDRF